MPPQAQAPADELAHGEPEREVARHRWGKVVLAVALALTVGLAVRDAARSERPEAAPADPSWYARDDGVNDLRGVTWPARGDLVRDHGFVSAALDRIRAARPDVSRVYFAGHLPDGSRLVLAGSDVLRGVVATSVHALHVPRGLDPGRATPVEADPLVDGAQVLVWLHRGRGGVMGVALTRPGPVRFEVSARVEFSEQSRAVRHWLPVPAVDGMAVLDLGERVDPVVAFRAHGAGAFTLPVLVRVEPRAGPEQVTVRGIGSVTYQGPPSAVVRRLLLRELGTVVDLRTASIRILWSGELWNQRRLALVLARDVDGRRFQALVGEQRGVEFPAGVRALTPDQPDGVPWLLEPFGPGEPTLLICPSREGTLRYRRGASPATELPVRPDGLVAVADPAPAPPSARGAVVTLLDPRGRAVFTTRIPTHGFEAPTALD